MFENLPDLCGGSSNTFENLFESLYESMLERTCGMGTEKGLDSGRDSHQDCLEEGSGRPSATGNNMVQFCTKCGPAMQEHVHGK